MNFLNIFEIAYVNLSYNLKIIEIWAPLTPGTITPIPIKKPSIELFIQLFKLYLGKLLIAVSQIKKFFKINTDNILIIHDDLDLNVGEVRIKPKGSSGGHNGLKSIFQYLGTENIKRIKIGIGKSEFDTIDYVLGKFTKEEKVKIDEAISLTSDAIDDYLKHNFDLCMSHFNKKLTKWAN